MPLVTENDGPPTVSVIVPSYNSRRTLPRCLDSLYAQDCDADCEVLVLDSSDDRTAELVQDRYLEVRLIRYCESSTSGCPSHMAMCFV